MWNDNPFAPAVGDKICTLSDLEDGIGTEFVFGVGKKPFRMFIIRKGEAVWGYVNACAHFGVPLNPGKGHTFLTKDGSNILCQVHYAKYAIEDGSCVSGECDGDSLQAVPLIIADDDVIIGN